MRNILFILFILSIITSCEQKITDAFAYSGILEVSETEMHFNAGAYSKTIEVKGVVEWDVDTNTIIEPWCQIAPVKDYKSKEYITVFVDPNEMTERRETKFQIVSGSQQAVVNVVQLGNIPEILFSSDSLVIGLDTNLLKINYVTNVEYEMSYNGDWFHVEYEDYQEDKRLIINVSANHTGIERKGVIIFKNKTGLEEWEWTFRQLSTQAPYTPTDVDKLNPNMKVFPISATASSEADGKGIEKSYDGNKLNYYQSKYQNETEPVVLEYSFDGTTPIDYINYIPYEGDTEKSFKITEIWVKEEGSEYELVKTQIFQKSGEQVVVFDNTIEKPQSIKFVVKSSYDTEKNLMVVACSEMEFYSAEMRYTDIFADPIYGSLKNDVTLDKIFDMEDLVFRSIAYHLYHNTYDEGRILKCISYPNVKKNYLTFNGSYGGLDNVTGVAVSSGEEVPIFANNIKQDIVYAVVFNPENPSQTKRYRLFDGINKIMADYDGHLYINYVSPEAKEIDVHIAGGRYNGYYDLSKQTTYELSNITTSSYIDVVGEYAQLLFKKEQLQGIDLASLVTAYDNIVRSQQVFMGLEKYQQEFNNNILFLEVSDKFEIKYENHYVTCPEIDIEKLTQTDKITGKTLWDLAVAVGTIHNHNALRWNGITYTTPKLFALATQQAFGESLQVNVDNWYSNAFSNIIVPEKKLASLRDDFYDYPEKIIPFWQLQIYATEVLGEDDFYADVLYKLRTSSLPPYFYERYFKKYVQDRLRLNLTDYFKRWGFSTTMNNGYNKAPKALVYLTSNNIEHFKQSNTAPPSADGYRVSGTRISIINPQNVVAYLVKHTFVPMQVFDVQSFQVAEWKNSMRIYAVSTDGTEVELSRL